MLAKKLTSESEDLHKIQKLYIETFPENERSDFNFLLDDISEIFSFYDGNVFCGFMSLLTYGDICHILYLAIDDSLRNNGYGTKALSLLRDMKSNCKILADIEIVTDTASNNRERIRRKDFYIKNGFAPSCVKYEWRGECYEILINGGSLSEKEFTDFWESAISIKKKIGKL